MAQLQFQETLKSSRFQLEGLNHTIRMEQPARLVQFVNDTQSSNEKTNLSTVDKISKEIAKQLVIVQLETKVS